MEKSEFYIQEHSCSFISSKNMMFSLLLFILNLLLIITVNSYNLDTYHPLIYEIPADGERGSYFGMSVAIRPKAASLKGTWSIQIGAPRGNVSGTGFREPGAVYRCHMYGPCKLFEVDCGLASSGGLGIYEFKEKKDTAWVGVAMDIKNFGSYEKTVVCGHRWINQNLKNPENIDVTYLMTGICYLQDLINETSETSPVRLLPLVNKDKIYTPKPYVIDFSTYHWGLGQAGVSVRFSEEPSSLMIGAPGVTHWTGSVIKYKNYLNVVIGSFANTELTRKSRYTYLGYSLASGRFYEDKEFWYAVGAPRSGNYHGEVVTFQFKGSFGDVQMGSNLVGATFGEYFGSSLAAADINNDGFDDLVVGAPLFSNKDPDEGRIYVYLGTERGYFLMLAQVVNGRVSQGRFGTCVTSVQDLDQDGYGDMAVGAPYENDRKGAVYIFRGFAKGLHADYSQRIFAQDIHPHLRGFGVSISSAVDADGNKYLDIAIGSYLSDHVVLIRSRPVISLHPEIKIENVSLIDRKDPYVNVTICSRYAGSNAPRHVDVTEIVEVDPVFGRGTLSLSKKSIVKKSFRLRSNEIICDINTITLNLSGKNFSPLHITVKNEINTCGNGKGSSLLIKGKKSEGSDEFPETCPIGNKAEASKEIPFAGICGPDLICRSDLELTCDMSNFRGSYTLDSSDVLTLSVRVKNFGEPAHHINIRIWSNLKLNHWGIGQEGSSSSATSSNIFWLPLAEILTDSYRTQFSFQIDFEDLKENDKETHINLRAEIFTSSLESNLQNNDCRLSAKLTSDAFLSFYASSSIASVYITKGMMQNQTLSVTHYYEIQKLGVTPVKDAELTIYIPFYFKKKVLSFKTETSEWMQLSSVYGHKQELISNGKGSSDLYEVTKKNGPPLNRTLYLNCSTAANNCKILKIFFAKGIPAEFSSYIKILFSLNITAIDLVKNERDIVHLSTTGMLKIFKFLSREPIELGRSAFTDLYSEERELGVSPHIIALSILAGGFLLSLIVTGLLKSNFFERIKKQELKALKNADASFVYFATAENSQAPRRVSKVGVASP